MNLKSNKFWIIVIGAVLAVCIAVIAILTLRPSKPAEEGNVGPIAVIRLDGKIVDAIDLGKVKEGYTIPFTGTSGNTNNVEVAPGKIRVHDATCPDQICVSQGWEDSTNHLLPIACLPNSLIIEVSSSEELGLDGVTK